MECLRYVDPVDRMTESAGDTRQLPTKFFRPATKENYYGSADRGGSHWRQSLSFQPK